MSKREKLSPEARSEIYVMMRDGGIDPKKTFETFKSLKGKQAAFKKCKEWNSTTRGLFLFGPTGTGKSHLANAIGHKAIVQWRAFAKFMTTPEIPRSDADAILDLVEEVPILILDDIGAERRTERALECLYMLIDGRLRRGVPLIVTSNYTIERLEGWFGKEYGTRLVGRLKEACERVPVGGKDMREDL
jgi:DNA replication protein DnaC